MKTRRDFIKKTTIGLAAAGVVPYVIKAQKYTVNNSGNPIVISTWNHGIPANEAAWKILSSGGKAIEASRQMGN